MGDMSATHGIKGQFHFDVQTGNWWVGDTEIREWLLSHFLQGTPISLYATELEPPKDWHIPEEQRLRDVVGS